MQPTVDASEIPNNHLGWSSNLVDHGGFPLPSSTGFVNAGFLNQSSTVAALRKLSNLTTCFRVETTQIFTTWTICFFFHAKLVMDIQEPIVASIAWPWGLSGIWRAILLGECLHLTGPQSNEIQILKLNGYTPESLTWFTWNPGPLEKGDPFWKPSFIRFKLLNFGGVFFYPKKGSF